MDAKPGRGRPRKDDSERRDRPLNLRASIVEHWRMRQAAALDGIDSPSAWLLGIAERRADRLGVPRNPTAAQLATVPLRAEKRSRSHDEPPAAEPPSKPRKAAPKKKT